MGNKKRGKARYRGGVLLSAVMVAFLIAPAVPSGAVARMAPDVSPVLGSAVQTAEPAPAASAAPASSAPGEPVPAEPIEPIPEAPASEELSAPPESQAAAEPPAAETAADGDEDGEAEPGGVISGGVSGSVSVSADPAPYLPSEPVEEEPSGAGEPDPRQSGGEITVAAAVEDDYFSDAVFLGDSRTDGFRLYSGLETGQYLCSVGATVSSVFTKATEETAGGKVPILDALDGMEFSKVYIMLGINELGWPGTDLFHDHFVKLVDRVRESHPDAAVVLESIPPVSSQQNARGGYVNNGRIQDYNTVILQVAEEKDCIYLDVGSALTGPDGCLPSGDNFDGVHLNISGCKKWLQFLKENPV